MSAWVNLGEPEQTPELRLVEGGPTYQIQLRMRLLERNAPRTLRRALLSIGVTWLPLLLLAAGQGVAEGTAVRVPFLHDISVYTRYLVALPLLIAAEVAVGRSVAEGASQFVDSGVVAPAQYEGFSAAVERALRMRDSNAAEALLAGLAYVTVFIGWHTVARSLPSWQRLASDSIYSLTRAGFWNVLVSLPLFLFLIYRWIWRLWIWYAFLFRMNRLDLKLVPTHPDRAGGLGFLNEAHTPFALVVLALGTTSAGVMAQALRIRPENVGVVAAEMATLLILMLALFVAPLMVFTPRLIRLRRSGMRQYGRLATRYTQSFHRKWIGGENPENEPMLGTSDIQSLADLGNSFAMVDREWFTPFNRRLLAAMIAACVVPMVPTVLTLVSMADILKFLGRVMFG